MRRTDMRLLAVAGVFVAGLALVAGAISFSHMQELAALHGQLGWKSYAFPISVDGLEIVASLYFVAQRRAGRAVGWIPWVALVVGTLASLAANVGVGGDDLIGRALAGWPALSMLVAIKLLFSTFERDEDAVADVQQPSEAVRLLSAAPSPSNGGGVPRSSTEAHDHATGGCTPALLAEARTTAPSPTNVQSSDRPALDGLRGVEHLIPAARAAYARLADSGRPVSRDALAATMREDGHGLSNAHASMLIRILRTETPHRAARPDRASDGN